MAPASQLRVEHLGDHAPVDATGSDEEQVDLVPVLGQCLELGSDELRRRGDVTDPPGDRGQGEREEQQLPGDAQDAHVEARPRRNAIESRRHPPGIGFASVSARKRIDLMDWTAEPIFTSPPECSWSDESTPRAPSARRSPPIRVLLCIGLLLGCQAESAPPHLVLIAIDTLRADHLGAYGYPLPTSPNIDRLARSGTIFTNAMAASSWTRPSVASLFTSRLPSEHGAVSFDRAVRDDLPTLTETLQRAGYHTLGVSGNFVHVSEQVGLERGFDEFHVISVHLAEEEGDALLRLPADGAPDVALRAPSAREVNRKVLAGLPANAEAPLFLFVHYMDPHAGYLPPEPFRSAFLPEEDRQGHFPAPTSDYVVEQAARAELPGHLELEHMRRLYDGEIAALDHAIGQLLEALEKRGFADDAVFVLVSDHGEEFGEHGGLFHGITLHGESLRVPLVIYDTRQPTDGVRRDEPVDLLDVAPTLLALAGIAPEPGMRGRPLLDPSLMQERELVAELHPDPAFEQHLRPRADSLALVRWPWKAIVARDGAVRAYRLDRDPTESNPLGPEQMPEGLARAARDLARRAAEADAGRPLDIDPQSRQELRALGYAE